MTKTNEKNLDPAPRRELVDVLKERFEKNMHRHRELDWAQIQSRLEAQPEKLAALAEMERTGGEPDVIGFDENAEEYIFCDCSPESPAARRSFCYDRAALDARKEHQPANSALEAAAAIGIELLSEEEYRSLQALGSFDTKTSSWLKTPAPIRKLGGALYGDRRYDTVFIYHNGASSYYAARGFRGLLRV